MGNIKEPMLMRQNDAAPKAVVRSVHVESSGDVYAEKALVVRRASAVPVVAESDTTDYDEAEAKPNQAYNRTNTQSVAKNLYMTCLTNDAYLDGVIALRKSLEHVGAKHMLGVMLAGDSVSLRSRQRLHDLGVDTFSVPMIDNAVQDGATGRWSTVLAKLRIFNLTQFDKLVFLDADTLVLENIDHLFDYPDMSAVYMKWNHEWNSGVMVVQPSRTNFQMIMRTMDRVGVHAGESDQEFLEQTFPEWFDRSHLHIGHSYNAYWLKLSSLVDGPCKIGVNCTIHGKLIKVLHFVGETKPWDPAFRRDLHDGYELQAVDLWWSIMNHAPNPSAEGANRLAGHHHISAA